MTAQNYEYISKNYRLPSWFDYDDIDWLRYYPCKDEIIYACNTKRTIDKQIYTEKRGYATYIYDDEKVKIYDIFKKYLAYLQKGFFSNDITDEEMEKLLNIKICDYDWLFMCSNPVYDRNSERNILQKI